MCYYGAVIRISYTEYMDLMKVVATIISVAHLATKICGCKQVPGGINPSSSIQTSTGINNTLATETFNHSIKTVATINLSGHIGGLIVFSVIFILLVVVYRKLSDYLTLVNDRLHNLAALFGIHGFAAEQPAIEADN